jgi:hypothetical protein
MELLVKPEVLTSYVWSNTTHSNFYYNVFIAYWTTCFGLFSVGSHHVHSKTVTIMNNKLRKDIS